MNYARRSMHMLYDLNENTEHRKKRKRTVWLCALVGVIVLALLLLLLVPKFLRMYFRMDHSDLIATYSDEYTLNPYFVSAVIHCESGNDPTAESHAGARGLMQVMPATGNEIALALGETEFSEEDLFVPETSVRFGCYYLREQMDRFDNNEKIVLAAYNAGPHRAEKWVSEYGLDSTGGICYIPFGETDRYVDKVLTVQRIYEILYKNHFYWEDTGC